MLNDHSPENISISNIQTEQAIFNNIYVLYIYVPIHMYVCMCIYPCNDMINDKRGRELERDQDAVYGRIRQRERKGEIV